MPSEIGPYDGRKARRKRCDACVKRKARCHGGVPCSTCKRTGLACTIAIKPTSLLPVFVGQHSLTETEHKRNLTKSLVHLPQPVDLGWEHRAVPYFFKVFLPMNNFSGGQSVEEEISTIVKTSRGLRDAIGAVATLHYKQNSGLMAGAAGDRCDRNEALQAYGRSVRHVQSRITSEVFLGAPCALWTTFVLGLFELMQDSTGTNWLSHFLNGTCVILRLQHPRALACPGEDNVRKRRFFFATRIFEIARSLIYSSPTFLSNPEWTNAIASLRKADCESACHPKEALFDLLPNVADLSIRAMNICESLAEDWIEDQYQVIESLAREGLGLQRSLQQWCVAAEWWEQASQFKASNDSIPTNSDSDLLMGYIYYHAISIYLSGTFDYHVHWALPGAPVAPIIPRRQIEHHVSEILRISQELLTLGVSGILLFFPLRVAGARAVDVWSRNMILDLLHTTASRGFSVAEAFTIDLSELWDHQSTMPDGTL
ncbi:hypothetical protein DE146DRAFT_642817 [Phaeosphaeria sp. MPI-PUGE-AT-0046c]|nr:hypothetical protein DE146DRAFT_642817 [Phaeosphaeria sp. MPI-PUGE-AT-0046c]